MATASVTPEYPATSNIDSEHSKVQSRLERLIQIRQTYLDMSSEVAKLELAALDKLGGSMNALSLVDRQDESLTAQEKLAKLANSKLDEVQRYLNAKRNLDTWKDQNLRKDSSMYSISARLRNAAGGFSVPDAQMTERLRMTDPGIRDEKNGNVLQMIDDNEEVVKVTNPLKLGESYLREFLLDPQQDLYRQNWEIVLQEGGKWLRRGIKDIKFDENKQMQFLVDPNTYTSRVNLQNLPEDSQGQVLDSIPEETVTQAGSISLETLQTGGRRMLNQTVDPAIHYHTMPILSEADVAGTYLVVKKPDPIVTEGWPNDSVSPVKQ